eukprot:GEMP01051683.1.p1 GENE.GEMP01051683.1~~GEMP01051683.1.p1  ORF type:complete len:217 (+),score=38.85 GEMP01051683.1:96-746(+)
MNWFWGSTEATDAEAKDAGKKDVATKDVVKKDVVKKDSQTTAGGRPSSIFNNWSLRWTKSAESDKTEAGKKKESVIKPVKGPFNEVAPIAQESNRPVKIAGVTLGLTVIIMAILGMALVYPWWPLYIVFTCHLCIVGSIMIMIELPDFPWAQKARRWIFQNFGCLRQKKARGVLYIVLGVVIGFIYPYALWLRIVAIIVGVFLVVFGVLEIFLKMD